MPSPSPTFECVTSLRTDYNGIPVAKYRSRRSGLTVAVVDIESPLVNGYFAVATEAHDDDGCPHTLEHLVFLGSEDYPYKGVLDSLANRALARGTNAWTDVDHTCYTVTTAGAEGFQNLLPIYLDHILYPTITDSGFTTEVHHINGNGEDAGVVYCEMQGRENTGDDLVHHRVRRLLYPEDSGYRSETGGLMRCLRTLTAQTIRDYHRDYYRAENLCVIVTGKVDHGALLKALEKVDAKIVAKSASSGPAKARPWVDSPAVKPLAETVLDTIEFPDEEEATGSVTIGWHGVKFSEFREETALSAMSEYLTQSAVALLAKEFVEIEDPYATSVDFHFLSYLHGSTLLMFEGVPTEKLELVRQHFFDVLSKHVAAGIDMDRMHLVMDRMRLQTLSGVESHASDFFAHNLIGEFLYGKPDGSELSSVLGTLKFLEELKTWTASQWAQLVRTYFLERPYVCVIGKPSAALAKKLEEDEEARVEAQRQSLGEAKLKQLDEAMKKAHAENEKPIPDAIFATFPVPSTKSIAFIPVESAQNPPQATVTSGKLAEFLKKDGAQSQVPYFIQFDQVNSAFVDVKVLVDSRDLTPELRLYLELYLELFFTLPIEKDGKRIEHEEVVRQLDSDTLSQSNTVGTDGNTFSAGNFAQLIKFRLKVEKRKYALVVQWFRDLLWNSVFTAERIKIAATKLLNDIPNHKREGSKMCSEYLKTKLYDETKSNHIATNVVRQQKFLSQVLERCEHNFDGVKAELEALRKQVCNLDRIRIHVTGNIAEIPLALSTWASFAPVKKTSSAELKAVEYSVQHLNSLGAKPSQHVYVVSMPAIESSYCIFMTTGPSTFSDSDIASLMVLNEYLSTMEGPFWKQVRGNGLAYGASLRLAIESSFISFVIYRSPDAYKAFQKVKDIIEDLSAGRESIDAKFLEAAKSSVIFSVIAREETMSSAADESFVNQVLRRVGAGGNREMLAKVDAVTVADLQKALNKYLVRLFDPASSVGCVTTTPSKLAEIAAGFTALHYTVQQTTLE